MYRKKINTNKKVNIGKFKIPMIYVVTMIAFIVATVYLTIQTATVGAELAHLEDMEDAISKENRDMKDFIVRSTSLTKASEQSAELGFVKPSNVLYLTPEETVANLP